MRTEEEKREFEINLEDLWSFERRVFKKNGLPLDFCEEVLDKMSSLVVEQTEPFLKQQKEGDEHYNYWKGKQAEYRVSLNKNNPFDSDLIYTGKAFYTHYSNVIVKSTTKDFELWFALKLRQYDSQLIRIQSYLEYHLDVNFKSSILKIKLFLQTVIRQFNEKVLSERVTLTVNEWLEYYKPNDENIKSSPTVKPRKVERTVSGKFDSFLFDSSNKKLIDFERETNNWSDLILRLSKNGFIPKSTKSKDLKNIFQNVPIDPLKRIVWCGSDIELHWFVKYFVVEKRLVEIPVREHWHISTKCFVQNNGEDFWVKKLSGARGKSIKRKNLLISILDETFDL